GPRGGGGPHAFLRPFAGSTAFAIGPALTGERDFTGTGAAILAADHQHALANPTAFYPTHLRVQATLEDDVSVELVGLTLPGVPGVVIGTNGRLAWTTTLSGHDVNDVYLESVVPCGEGSCTVQDGLLRPIETITEEIHIGVGGAITETRTVTYEHVADHGPIIPRIVDGTLMPRTVPAALSIKYTGHAESFEIRALAALAVSTTVRAGFEAVGAAGHGGNWMFIDAAGDLGWTTHAIIPERQAGAYDWSPASPDGAAPFFVLDGTGGHEWIGQMLPRYVPHARFPAADVLITADADPVGASYDGDPLNQRSADGVPLYAGVAYAPGLREERLATLLAAVPRPVTVEDVERLHHDTASTVGAKLVPAVLVALRRLDDPGTAPADVPAFVATLTAEQRQRLVEARDVLASWTFETSRGDFGAEPSSAATLLFNTWLHGFARAAIGDELAQAGYPLDRLDDAQLVRILHGLLVEPARRISSALTAQPILCDRLASPGEDSCTKLILETLLEALGELDGGPADWRWGREHRLVIAPLLDDPGELFRLPLAGETTGDGYSRAGDTFSVDRGDGGWGDLDFAPKVAVAHRFTVRSVTTGFEDISTTRALRVRLELPGGTVFDRRDPHYRDLLDGYLRGAPFDVPTELAEINRNGESRWELR
nr:penicillin acylase family protein [Myxococcota bacterium]